MGGPSRWSRRRAAVAIVAGLSLVAVALGCWSPRSDVAPGASDAVVTALSAPGVGHADSSASNDDKAFKSGGLKRDRAQGLPIPAPRSSGALSSLTRAAWVQRPIDQSCRAPATGPAGQDLLARLCVCRC